MFRLEDQVDGSVRVFEDNENLVAIIRNNVLAGKSYNNHIISKMGVCEKMEKEFSPVVVLDDIMKCIVGNDSQNDEEILAKKQADELREKTAFLNLFNLVPRVPSSDPIPQSTIGGSVLAECSKHLKSSRNGTLGYELSSSFGKKLLTDRHLVSNQMECVNRYDKYCCVSKRRLFNGDYYEREPCAYDCNTTNTSMTTETYGSCHQYCFNKRQIKERLKLIKTGLNKRGRQLLKQCKHPKVVLERINEKEVKRWTSERASLCEKKTEIEVIDLIDSEDETPSLTLTKQVNCKVEGTTRTSKVRSPFRDVLNSTSSNKSTLTNNRIAKLNLCDSAHICNVRNVTIPVRNQMPTLSFTNSHNPFVGAKRSADNDSDSDLEVEYLGSAKGSIIQKNHHFRSKVFQMKYSEVKLTDFKKNHNPMMKYIPLSSSTRFRNQFSSSNTATSKNEVVLKCKLCGYQKQISVFDVIKRSPTT